MLAFAATRTLPWRLGERLVAGTEPCDTVPFAMSWTLGWNFDRFAAGFADYWNAPIFHATPGVFALSEPMPLVAAMAWPVHLLGGSLAAATTFALLTQLVLDGIFVRRLALRCGVGRALAALGGAIAMLLPFVHQELGVLALVPLWGIAWMFTALLDLLGPGRRPNLRAGVELGLATVASWLCSEQLTFFAALLFGPCALTLLRRRHFGRVLPVALAIASSIAALGVLPIALPQRQALSALGLRRNDASRSRGGASVRDLVRAPWRGPLPLPRAMIAERPGDRAFFIGPVRVGLAAVGAASSWQRVRRRRPVAMLVVLVVGATLLALGNHVHVGGFVPLDALARVVPGLDRIRSLFRAIALAQLGLVLLAMIGLHALRVHARRRRSSRAMIGVAIAAVLALVELWPPAPRTAPLPPEDPAWVRWLVDHAEPGTALALLPFAESGDVCDYEATASVMIATLGTDHPLVNGYSSYFPGRHDRTARDTRMLPDPVALQRLRGVETRWLVSPDDGPLADLDASTLGALGIELAMHDDDAAMSVYALHPAP